MHKGRILKLSDNENELRTDHMDGEFKAKPKVGKRFVIMGEPLTAGASVRMISTSPVVSIAKINNGWELETENSKYRVTTTP